MTLYHPKNDSLSERIQGFQSSLKALKQVEASRILVAKKEWSQSLGENSELDAAYEICRDSLNMAVQNIQPSEIQQALKSNLIQAADAKQFMQANRLEQIRKSRERQTMSKTKGPDFEPD